MCKKDGVDNTGRVIFDRLPNNNVDKIFTFSDGRQILIEIKTIPERVRNFFTFKASSLLACIEQNAWIIVPRSYAYYIIPTKICESLYKNYPHLSYKNFANGKISVRILASEIEKLINKKTHIQNKLVRKIQRSYKK